MGVEKRYFLHIKKHNIGPLKFEDIVIRIKKGMLHGNDYIFAAGSKSWARIRDHKEFMDLTNDISSSEKKLWYVRKDRDNIGPLSQREMTRLLRSGYIDISDYVWRKGYSGWVQISSLGGK